MVKSDPCTSCTRDNVFDQFRGKSSGVGGSLLLLTDESVNEIFVIINSDGEDAGEKEAAGNRVGSYSGDAQVLDEQTYEK